MRVFISCDIEGVTTTTRWEDTDTQKNPMAAKHALQMTKEVVAACEGAIAAGADYILVKDAHGPGVNIDVTMLPKCVEVIRNWSGHPYGMAFGVDKTFDAAMFIGYHAGAGREGNPLSHTMTLSTIYTKINGHKASEFELYSYACALEGVPTVFLSGDKMLCEDSAELHPLLKTVAVKEGFGSATKSINPELACELIRKGAEEALRQNLKKALATLPPKFTYELCYKEHHQAEKMSFYPGFKRISDNIIQMKTKNFVDILRASRFVL